MKNTKAEDSVRNILLILCEAFTLYTLITLLINKDYENLPICIVTFALVFIPIMVEKWFSCRIAFAVYLFAMVYTISPMLGDCYKLYYSTIWWDKLLHTFGGVVFALFGLYLFEHMGGNKSKYVACAIFALCFSMALSVAWEFFEFGSDQLFGTDMQHDSIITSFNSYALGNEIGTMGSVENVTEVIVNGQPLPINGYLDIGLIDSMTDMLLETLGAVFVAAGYVLDKGKHPAFVAKAEYEKARLQAV